MTSRKASNRDRTPASPVDGPPSGNLGPGGMRRYTFGTWAVAAVALTSSWTDVSIGGVLKLSDVFCLVALLATSWSIVLGARRTIVVGWAVVPLATTFLAYVYHVVVLGEPAGEGAADIARVFFGLTSVAWLCFSLRDGSGERGVLVMRAWVAGAGINALTAWMLQVGLLPTGWRSTELDSAERAIGLAFHPNSLAFSMVVVLPVACLLLSRSSSAPERLVWFAVIGFMVNALVAADSRAGLGIGLGILALSLLGAVGASRFRAATAPIAITGGIALVAVVVPFLGSSTRLASGAGDLSDVGREAYNAEGLARFASNPWVGAGFDEAIGTSMYVHLLSETGIVGAIGYFTFVVGSAAVVMRWATGLPRMLALLSLAAALTFGLVQPGITERATYWGVLLVASMGASIAGTDVTRGAGGRGPRGIIRTGRSASKAS